LNIRARVFKENCEISTRAAAGKKEKRRIIDTRWKKRRTKKKDFDLRLPKVEKEEG